MGGEGHMNQRRRILLGCWIGIFITITGMLTYGYLVMWPKYQSRMPHFPVTPLPLTTTEQLHPNLTLTIENVRQAQELARFVPIGFVPGPIAALAITPDGQTILAAYAHEGVVRHWQLEKGELLKTVSISPIGITATAFDEQGTLIVTAAGNTPRAEANGEVVDIRGALLWDPQTGECIWDMDKTLTTKHTLSGIAVSSNGQQIARIEPQSLDIENIANPEDSTLMSLGGTEDPFRNLWIPTTPDVVTFDSTGEYLAWADQEGRVGLVGRDSQNTYHLLSRGQIDRPRRENYTEPLAIRFDHSRRWLAVVRGDRFEWWSLTGERIRRAGSVVISVGLKSDIAFSPISDLVAVGTDSGWQIWDIVRKKKLVEGGNVATYALRFSSDGRLFIWGDAQGEVHVWGIPVEQ